MGEAHREAVMKKDSRLNKAQTEMMIRVKGKDGAKYDHSACMTLGQKNNPTDTRIKKENKLL